MNKFNCVVWACAMLIGGKAVASPAPLAPVGWTREAVGSSTLYRPADSKAGGQFTLFAPEPGTGAAQAWFIERTNRASKGIEYTKQGPAKRLPGSEAFSRYSNATRSDDRRSVVVVGFGCESGSKLRHYGEWVSLLGDPALRQHLTQAAGVMGAVCAAEAPVPSDAASGARIVSASAPLIKPARVAPLPYPYQTAPNAGLKKEDIEAVVLTWEQVWNNTVPSLREDTYLLLKDGTVRQGVPPVALADFDVQASRRGEPNRWGHWKRSGRHYQLAWAQSPSRFESLINELVREPARPGETLHGYWSSTTAARAGLAFSSSERGIRFTSDGHFETTSSGAVRGAIAGAAPDPGVHSSSTWNDSGSSTSIGNAQITLGTAQRQVNPKADRMGRYELDGYNLVLNYANGQVRRLPFFAQSDRKIIWFEGRELRMH